MLSFIVPVHLQSVLALRSILHQHCVFPPTLSGNHGCLREKESKKEKEEERERKCITYLLVTWKRRKYKKNVESKLHDYK